jgi:GNAT superfamily N-acetyltransferase
VSPAEHHVTLDRFLATRGYARGGPTSVLKAGTDEVLAATSPRHQVDLTPAMTDAWKHAFATIDHHNDNPNVAEHVISKIALPTAFATVTIDGEVAGIALFVGSRPGGWTAVLCMATHPSHRRRGIATAILNAGAKWSKTLGADRLYLQVEEENTPARHLYGAKGFTHSHSYHYRTKPQP